MQSERPGLGTASDNYIDDVTELPEKHGGDAEEIMAGLRNGEVDGFWEGKKDELEQYLEDNGYIEPIDSLAPEEIHARVTQVFLSNEVSRENAGDRGTNSFRGWQICLLEPMDGKCVDSTPFIRNYHGKGI